MPEALPSLDGGCRLPERLIQLVPRFRPDADGLGDAAMVLSDVLWRRHGVPSDFVVWQQPHPNPELPAQGGDVAASSPHRVFRLPRQRPADLANILDQFTAQVPSPVMLLHYSPYGYSREGIPVWLPGLIRGFTQRGGRVVGFFHELYPERHLFSKTLIVSGVQRRLLRRILPLCAVGITSNSDYIRRMSQLNRMGRPLVQAGVWSNVGELVEPTGLESRPRRLAIFGQHQTRGRLYEQHLTQLQKLCVHLGIAEVADIGPVGDKHEVLEAAGQMLAGKLKVYGPLPNEQVSALLAGSQAGAVNYTFDQRFKSGIVAAYQAHALPVVLFRPTGDPVPSEFDTAFPTPDRIMALPVGCVGLTALLEDASHAGFKYYRENRSYDSVLTKILPWLQVN